MSASRGMPSLKPWFACAWLSVVWVGCSEVISERSDLQVWMEFNRHELVKRAPASDVGLQSRLDRISGRELLFSCNEFATREVCYREALQRKFDEAYRSEKNVQGSLSSDDYRREQGRFLASLDYPVMVERVDRFHRELLSGIEITARDQLRRLFFECEKASASQGLENRIERFDLIGAITTEIPKSVYACLVAGWISTADRVIADASQRLGVRMETPGARLWVRQRQVFPMFESELSSILNEKAKRESEELEKLKSSLRNEIHPFQTDEQALSRFAPELRRKFPYTRVEQWILQLKNSQK